jgi:hypothetical protein
MRLILSRQQSKAEEPDCQFNNPQNHRAAEPAMLNISPSPSKYPI